MIFFFCFVLFFLFLVDRSRVFRELLILKEHAQNAGSKSFYSRTRKSSTSAQIGVNDILGCHATNDKFAFLFHRFYHQKLLAILPQPYHHRLLRTTSSLFSRRAWRLFSLAAWCSVDYPSELRERLKTVEYIKTVLQPHEISLRYPTNTYNLSRAFQFFFLLAFCLIFCLCYEHPKVY